MDEARIQRTLGRIEGKLDAVIAQQSDQAKAVSTVSAGLGETQRELSHLQGRASVAGAFSGLVASLAVAFARFFIVD